MIGDADASNGGRPNRASEVDDDILVTPLDIDVCSEA